MRPAVLGEALLIVAREGEALGAVAAAQRDLRREPSAALCLSLSLLARSLLSSCSSRCLLRCDLRRLLIEDSVELAELGVDLVQPIRDLVALGALKLRRAGRESCVKLSESLLEGGLLESEHRVFLLHDESRHCE